MGMLSQRQTCMLLIWLVIGMVVAGVWGAGIFHYSADHIAHLRIASGRDITEVIQFSRYENHPPLGYILWHFWMQWFHSPAGIQSLGLCFTIGAMLAGYRIGFMLDGRLSGLCISLLIVTAHGVVVQSFLVRNYAMLVCFLMMQFCCYLLWLRSGSSRAWGGYVLASLLALTTHFYALLSIGTLTLAYLAEWKKRRYEVSPVRMLFTQCALGAVGGVLFLCWLPSFLLFTSQMHSPEASGVVGVARRIIFASLYPLPTFMYFSAAEVTGVVICLLLPIIIRKGNGAVRSLLPYAYAALAIAIGTYVTGAALMMASHHELWLLPFLLPPVGVALAQGIVWAGSKWRVAPLTLFIVLALLLQALAIVDPDRFQEQGEHEYSEQTWQNVDRYFSSLSSNDLVVVGRQDALLFAPEEYNPYRLFAATTPSGKEVHDFNLLIPLKQSHMLFSAYYLWMRTYERLMLLARQLQTNPQLAGVKTLVFVKSLADINHEAALTCDKLERKVMYYPDDTEKSADPSTRTILVVEISRQAFLDDLINPQGKAHSCMPVN